MAYLIDTNIAIHARDGTDSVPSKLSENAGKIILSALSLAELQCGLGKNLQHAALRMARLAILLPRLSVIPFDEAAAIAYGRIIGQCGWVKSRDFDRMIAASAIATASTLVTNNLGDFSNIPGLALENWITS